MHTLKERPIEYENLPNLLKGQPTNKQNAPQADYYELPLFAANPFSMESPSGLVVLTAIISDLGVIAAAAYGIYLKKIQGTKDTYVDLPACELSTRLGIDRGTVTETIDELITEKILVHKKTVKNKRMFARGKKKFNYKQNGKKVDRFIIVDEFICKDVGVAAACLLGEIYSCRMLANGVCSYSQANLAEKIGKISRSTTIRLIKKLRENGYIADSVRYSKYGTRIYVIKPEDIAAKIIDLYNIDAKAKGLPKIEKIDFD